MMFIKFGIRGQPNAEKEKKKKKKKRGEKS